MHFSRALRTAHGRALAGLLPFVAGKMRPDALAIRDLNFNSWPASFQVKELLKRKLPLTHCLPKQIKFCGPEKNGCGSGNLLMSAGCGMATGFSLIGPRVLSNSNFCSNA